VDTRAAILAGGTSSRVGLNKALLRLREDGPTLIEIVVGKLWEAGFSAPLLLTNSPLEYSFLGLETAADEVPGAGPLAGIVAGLEHSRHERMLVVACDMPLLNPPLLRFMASLPGGYEAIVPRWRDATGEARVEPLHAIYSKACVPHIRRRLASGDYRAHALFQDLSVRYVQNAEIRRFDPQFESFRNVNTLEDWEELRDSLSK